MKILSWVLGLIVAVPLSSRAMGRKVPDLNDLKSLAMVCTVADMKDDSGQLSKASGKAVQFFVSGQGIQFRIRGMQAAQQSDRLPGKLFIYDGQGVELSTGNQRYFESVNPSEGVKGYMLYDARSGTGSYRATSELQESAFHLKYNEVSFRFYNCKH